MDETGNAIHARLAVEPDDCLVADLVRRLSVRSLVPPGKNSAPQAVVGNADPATLRDYEGIEPVLALAETVVCRLPGLADPDCGHGHCLARGLDFLPVVPYNARWRDTTLHLSLAATDPCEIQGCRNRLREAGFGVEVEHLMRHGTATDREQAVVNLDRLTDRQRELAREAARRGYFEADGSSAEELTEDFDISKATLSEHLRAVQAELLDQVFADEVI